MLKIKKRNFTFLLLIIVLITVFVRVFFFELVFVSGYSMLPTLDDKDLILVKKMYKDISRGDVIIFKTGDGAKLVKRVIGLSGETIEIKDGIIIVNRNMLEAEYQGLMDENEHISAYRIPNNHVYVLGDNRSISVDSRTIGVVKKGDIIGIMLFD